MTVAQPTRRRDLQRFVLAASVVAILDISFVATYWVVIRGATTFPRILRSIASGALGKAASQGGASAALLGGFLHRVVAAGWTAVFLLAARKWPAFERALQGEHGAVKVGMPFGIMVWLAMTFIIIPLSHATPASPASSWFWICLAWHAVGVGLPMAVIIRAR